MEEKIEKLLLLSRWLLLPMLLGMVMILVVFEMSFLKSIYDAIVPIAELEKNALILLTLDSIDMVLIAGLIIMVVITSYKQFIRPFGGSANKELPDWIAGLGGGELKLKIIGTLLLISSIHLLHLFFEDKSDNMSEFYKGAIVQVLFILTAGALSLLDRNKENND